MGLTEDTMTKNYKHCCIFVGGAPIYAEGFRKDFFDGTDLIIAADSGCAQLERLCGAGFALSPQLILGDMDSFPKERALSLYPSAEFVPFPTEKDYTDTQLALDTALGMGAETITVIGGTGNRADHYLANLALLRHYAKIGVEVRIFDGKNLVSFESEGETVIENGSFRYFSLIPDGDSLSGVDIVGAKYPLRNAEVDRDLPITVSNEITEEKCIITVKRGMYFLILCSD